MSKELLQLKEYQGKTCVSGSVYNYLRNLNKKVDIYEFDFLLNKALKLQYTPGDLDSFTTEVWNAVQYALKCYGCKLQILINEKEEDTTARAILKSSPEKYPVFLFVKASELKYDPAFRYSGNAMHLICICDYSDSKYYISDSYISNAPLSSFFGWIGEEEIHGAWSKEKWEGFYIETSRMDWSVIEKERILYESFSILT